MSPSDLIPVSDIYRLAVLNMMGISPVKTDYKDYRYWGFFDPEKAETILADYENGTLRVVARDLSASIVRVKDRIFEMERAQKRNGEDHEKARSKKY